MNLIEIKRKLQTAEYDFLRNNENLGNNIILLGLGGSYAYRETEYNLLMEIRNGKYLDDSKQPTKEFYELVDKLEKRLEYDKKNTILPDQVDMNKVNDFVASVNEKVCFN